MYLGLLDFVFAWILYYFMFNCLSKLNLIFSLYHYVCIWVYFVKPNPSSTTWPHCGLFLCQRVLANNSWQLFSWVDSGPSNTNAWLCNCAKLHMVIYSYRDHNSFAVFLYQVVNMFISAVKLDILTWGLMKNNSGASLKWPFEELAVPNWLPFTEAASWNRTALSVLCGAEHRGASGRLLHRFWSNVTSGGITNMV